MTNADIARNAAAALRDGRDEDALDGYDALRAAYPDETDAIDECEDDDAAATMLDELAAAIDAE